MNHYYRVRQGFECGDTNLKQGEQGNMGYQFLMSPVAEFIPSLANITHVAFPAPYGKGGIATYRGMSAHPIIGGSPLYLALKLWQKVAHNPNIDLLILTFACRGDRGWLTSFAPSQI